MMEGDVCLLCSNVLFDESAYAEWSLVVLTQKGLLEIVNASEPRNDEI